MPFKAKADCRRHIPRQRHRGKNWAEYDAGLRARGSLTIWFTAEAIEAWRAEPRTGRGGQARYSNLAITTALMLRAVFRLALRQTEGLIGSIVDLLGLDLAVPDHSTLSRRAETLEISRPKAGSEPVHLLVDSTGLRLFGPGEWLVEKHGTRRRRGWRKLHIATNADTGRIVASALTDKGADDGAQVGPDTATGCGCHRSAALERGAKRICRDRADAAGRTFAMYRRARSHGLAAGIRVQLARSDGGRYRPMEMRHRRWAAFTNRRAPADRSGRRCLCAEPHA